MEPKIQKITHNESQSSSQMVASIDDLLIQIFLRIPMKTLVRFKLVSKQWQSVISDPGFGILRNPNPNPATGLILRGPREFQRTNEIASPYACIVSFENTNKQIRTLRLINPWPCETITMTSCNGLLLCVSFNDLGYKPNYYVCNPTTNKYCKLPQIPDEDRMRLLPMCLAFDPTKSPHYKVVCALKSLEYEDKRYKFVVYSSETRCWRKSCVEPFQAASVDFERGVYWNGAMHWISKTKTGKSIYFNPGDDRMSQEIMPTPPVLFNTNTPYYFGESCGHLHYINTCLYYVYELKRDYSEWFVKYRINHGLRFSVGLHKNFLCAVVRGKSDDDDSFYVVVIGGKLVRYNFLNKTSETICEVEGSQFHEQCLTKVGEYLPLQHAESLCSV